MASVTDCVTAIGATGVTRIILPLDRSVHDNAQQLLSICILTL